MGRKHKKKVAQIKSPILEGSDNDVSDAIEIFAFIDQGKLVPKQHKSET